MTDDDDYAGEDDQDVDDDSANDDDEVFLDADSDEDMVQSNEAANKKYPFAHRLLDDTGLKKSRCWRACSTLLMRFLHVCRSQRVWG